jgi:hypothetical protein
LGRTAPVYGWFIEGFDTRDLREAKALLDELRWIARARRVRQERLQGAQEMDARADWTEGNAIDPEPT